MKTRYSLKAVMRMVDVGSALHMVWLKLVNFLIRSRNNNDTSRSSLSIGSYVNLISPSMRRPLPIMVK